MKPATEIVVGPLSDQGLEEVRIVPDNEGFGTTVIVPGLTGKILTVELVEVKGFWNMQEPAPGHEALNPEIPVFVIGVIPIADARVPEFAAVDRCTDKHVLHAQVSRVELWQADLAALKV